ncbi:MAG: hypothetical protein COB34_03955 [Methylophilaceae bacterium]|nr:MAG: hypothetical protein COB34_03955 [Methylophilaceae bacterium]
MEILSFTLKVITAIGVVGYVVSWIQAYNKVENIDKWSQQFAALAPWWILDGSLLTKEHEHIRYRAIKFFVLYVLSLFISWRFS